ncbi:receptor-like protein EIX2 [Amaranthus tricolor]|uniref:receptor-like protein EIX2 n=1 Tax=Amaranthus tricolor TaxID=29722 RepID=UPI0025827FAD|nr:receptor-like protein EIX2 [Amaranthus tricolor]
MRGSKEEDGSESRGCLQNALLSLDLSYNRIWGSIPKAINKFSSLRNLLIGNNQLNGTISQGIGTLSMLENLDISSNSLQETLSDAHFSNLSRLSTLDMSGNPNIVLHIRDNWIPPFQLMHLNLESCKLGPYFPKWIVTQTNLSYLGISDAGIHDSVPTSFWNSLSPLNLDYLNVSNNMIYGPFPDLSITLQKLPIIDFSSNNLRDLSLNHISGTIPKCIYNLTAMTSTHDFDDITLSNYVYIVDAKLMWKWKEHNFQRFVDQVKGIEISDNELEGQIPQEVASLTGLVFLNLSRNHLVGRVIPISLAQVTCLEILDLSKNNLSGKIPIGTQLQGFDPSSYSGKCGLCGALLPKCPGDEPSGSKLKGQGAQNREKDGDTGDNMTFLGLLISVVLGFWVVFGTLIIKMSWTNAIL